LDELELNNEVNNELSEELDFLCLLKNPCVTAGDAGTPVHVVFEDPSIVDKGLGLGEETLGLA
jgi:hypothetical protein